MAWPAPLRGPRLRSPPEWASEGKHGGAPRAQSSAHDAIQTARQRHWISGSSGSSDLGAHWSPDGAFQNTQEGPPLAAGPVEVGWATPATAGLSEDEGQRSVPEVDRGAGNPKVVSPPRCNGLGENERDCGQGFLVSVRSGRAVVRPWRSGIKTPHRVPLLSASQWPPVREERNAPEEKR